MKQRIIPTVCITATVFLLLIRCTAPTGGGTETGNARISSMLYNPGGTPAANAKVCFFAHDNDPRPGKGTGVVDSTTTDANGNYTAKLDTGTYNILASSGNNATFQDSIKVYNDSTTRPPADTLKALGGISGKIELQSTDDPRTVFILFMGSNTFTMVKDTLGNFSATNMAKGKYRVRILTTLDNYKVMDTAFAITAGKDSVIPTPIQLEYTGIPVPKGLKIAYDTMKEIVTLTWNKPTTGSAVKGYNIYRRNVDSNATLKTINTQLVEDTVYRDSTGVQDLTYEYRVAAVDTNSTEGTKSMGIKNTVIGALNIIDSVMLPFGIASGQLQAVADGAVDQKGNIYVIDRINGRNKRLQIFDSSGNCKLTVDTFSYPVALAITLNNETYVADRNNNEIIKFDSLGQIINRCQVADPLRYLFFNETMLFASTDVGINIYDEKDSLIHKMSFPFDWRNGGGVIVSDSIGQVYITDSKTLFLVNTPDKTILTITKFPYGYYQNITVSIFDSTRLIVSAQNGNANGSVLFLINKNNGEILAKWSTTENISSCTVKNDHTIYVFTFSNKILKLVFKSNLFK